MSKSPDTQPQMAGWCAFVRPQHARPFVDEAPGYFAMLAFLVAYLLNVTGSSPLAQALLNLAGAGAAVLYLHRKGALPSVISNVAWIFITVAGMVVR